MHRVLLIDNDPASFEMVTKSRRSEGFAVTWMRDGKNGLKRAMATEYAYDLILLDPALPGINGLDVLQRIRSRFDTPIILLAGKTQKRPRVVGLKLGADDFLVKPCNQRELLARIRVFLRRTKNCLNYNVSQAPRRI